MTRLEDFLGTPEPEEKPEGIPWEATVLCQTCQKAVFEQTLYPAEALLVWTCELGHKSYIENYRAF